jgi:hypothetical protein
MVPETTQRQADYTAAFGGTRIHYAPRRRGGDKINNSGDGECRFGSWVHPA